MNGGRFVGDRLKPDAPTSVRYNTWPKAYTPPFHFRGQYPGLSPLAAAPSANLSSHELEQRCVERLAPRMRRAR